MDKLTMIEKVVATMDAKEVRTLIVVCNDRLSALGEPVHQNTSPTTKGGGKRYGRKPYYMKAIPQNCDDTIKTFKDIPDGWVNDLAKHGKPCLVSVRGQGYHVVEYKQGKVLLIGTISIDDANKICSGSTVHEAVAAFWNKAGAAYQNQSSVA